MKFANLSPNSSPSTATFFRLGEVQKQRCEVSILGTKGIDAIKYRIKLLILVNAGRQTGKAVHAINFMCHLC